MATGEVPIKPMFSLLLETVDFASLERNSRPGLASWQVTQKKEAKQKQQAA
jgi:hypothetical protein